MEHPSEWPLLGRVLFRPHFSTRKAGIITLPYLRRCLDDGVIDARPAGRTRGSGGGDVHGYGEMPGTCGKAWSSGTMSQGGGLRQQRPTLPSTLAELGELNLAECSFKGVLRRWKVDVHRHMDSGLLVFALLLVSGQAMA